MKQIISLDANPENSLTAHRNHLIEYYPKEDTLPNLLADFQVPERDRFYKNLARKRNRSLNRSITKETLRGPQVEFPVFAPDQEDPGLHSYTFPVSATCTPDSGVISDQTDTQEPPG